MKKGKFVLVCLVQAAVSIRMEASDVHSVGDSSSERIVIEDNSVAVYEEEISMLKEEIKRLKENETDREALISEIQFLKTENKQHLAYIAKLEQDIKRMNDNKDQSKETKGDFNINSEGVYSDGSVTAMKVPMSEVPTTIMTTQQVTSALKPGDVSASQAEQDVYVLGDYICEKKLLGEGAFGLVLKGYLKGKENELVAIKVLKTNEPRMQAAAKQEFDMLTKISHKHVIKCVDSLYHNGVFCAVSEFANEGDLRQLIKKQDETKWKPTEVQDYFSQISHGMAFLHDQNIMHRDLKPANIVVFRLEDGEIVMKIADFGLAKEFDDDNKQSSISRVGTEVYMSPEMLNRAKYSYANDVWALGCILFELCLLKRVFEKLEDIFDKETRKTKLQDISKIAVTGIFTTSKDKTHWTELSNVCKLCLDSDAKNRLTCRQLYGRMMYIDMKTKGKKSLMPSLGNTNKGVGIDYNRFREIIMNEDMLVLKSFMTIDGFDVNKFDEYGRTPLMIAAEYNKNPDVVQELLKLDDIDVNKQETKNGWTALITAVEYNKPDIVKELLKRSDIDVNKQNDAGRTALIWAVNGNKPDIVKELLKRSDTDINKQDKGGLTALMTAARYNTNPDVIKELLKLNDIDVNKQSSNGWTALILAVIENKPDIVKELLKRSDIDINKQDNDGNTALMLAANYNKPDILKELLKRDDINVNKQDSVGSTALMKAVYQNKPDIVKELLKRSDTDVNKQTKGGLTALMRAARYNTNPDIIKELLKLDDIDVNKQDQYGVTALMFAVYKNKPDSIKELLKRKDIDLKIQDKDGRTALDIAREKGRQEIVTLLSKE